MRYLTSKRRKNCAARFVKELVEYLFPSTSRPEHLSLDLFNKQKSYSEKDRLSKFSSTIQTILKYNSNNSKFVKAGTTKK
jgi:hypothetical protein